MKIYNRKPLQLKKSANLTSIQTYKKKVCLIGCLEWVKNEFQKKMSSNYLSIEHKNNIGVSISTIDYPYDSKYNFNYFLWNIDCGVNRCFIRTTFYTGAEAIIVFISEDKVEQIIPYFNEIRYRMPIITLIFCIVLKNHTINSVIDASLKRGEFQPIFQNNNFKIKYINKSRKIFKQISSSFLKKIKTNVFTDNYIINFVPFETLVTDLNTNIECNDYCEPNRELSPSDKRLNTEKIKHFLRILDIETDSKFPDWVRINNQNFGIFSVFLRNGSVYFTPKKCKHCKNKRCSKHKKAQHFICIEGESDGWSNVKGLNKEELIVISKILSLQEATPKNLPISILKQIDKIKKCEN